MYVYRVKIYGYNLSLFRIVFILWIALYVRDVLVGKKNIKISHIKYIVLFLGIIAINIIDILRIDDYSLVKDVINHLINMSLVFLIINYVDTENKLDTFIFIFILGSAAALFISIFSFFTIEIPFEHLLKSFQSDELNNLSFIIYYESMIRLSSSFYDPNYYGLYICFILTFSFYYYNYVAEKLLVIFLLFLNAIALFLTLSRTAIIGFFIIIFLTAVLIKRFWLKLMWLIPLMILGIVYYYSFPEKLSEHIFWGRFADAESLLNRFIYYEVGCETFINNPWTGGSSQSLANELPHSSAHIVYLSILAKYGIIGFLIYSIFIFYPVYYVIKYKSELKKKYVYLLSALYLPTLIMYLGYDFFQFLEFQYIVFGIVYSIILNRIGKYRLC